MTPANFQAIPFFVLQLDQIDNKLVRNEKRQAKSNVRSH